MRPNPTFLRDDYVFNLDFEMKFRPGWDFDRIVRECTYLEGSSVNFLTTEYRTYFGPSFNAAHNFYESSDKGLVGAWRRLSSVRKPEIFRAHEIYKENQENIMNVWGEYYHNFKSQLKSKLPTILPREEAIPLWVETGPKKLLKIRTRLDFIKNGRQSGKYMKLVDYKTKSGELLDPNKYLRGIGDYTTAGSFRAGAYIQQIKTIFEEFIGDDFRFVFKSKPSRDDFIEFFDRVLNPRFDIEFIDFSDDAIISIKHLGVHYYGNFDVSACDGSHYNPIFELAQRLLTLESEYDEDVRELFAQFDCDFKMKFSKTSVLAKNIGFKKMGSGHACTTLMNVIACLSCCIGISRLKVNHLGSVQDLVELGCASVGYFVKFNLCDRPQKLQFLKYSPFFVNGKITPQLNLGVLIKTFGSCRGDLPGKRKSDRVSLYIKEVLGSYVHAGNNAIFNAFRKRFGVGVAANSEKVLFEDSSFVPVDELCIRYSCSSVEIEEALLCIQECKRGHHYKISFFEKVMAVDYGV